LGDHLTATIFAVLLTAAQPGWTSAVVAAQDTVRKPPVSKTARTILRDFTDSVLQSDSLQAMMHARVLPRQCPEDSALHADSAVMRACREAWIQYFAYQRFGLAHRQGVFKWQLLSSEITFLVVVLLVVAGVFFSWVQFRAELPRHDQSKKSPGEKKTEELVRTEVGRTSNQGQELAVQTQSVHRLKADASGFEVSSPVLGVIILALSLLFFYLYLKFVYPIHEVF
jgi:hypothetical protein